MLSRDRSLLCPPIHTTRSMHGVGWMAQTLRRLRFAPLAVAPVGGKHYLPDWRVVVAAVSHHRFGFWQGRAPPSQRQERNSSIPKRNAHGWKSLPLVTGLPPLDNLVNRAHKTPQLTPW